MSKNRHYFIAIPIASDVKQELFKWYEFANPPFKRPVHQQDYHITLVFLGSIEATVLYGLEKELIKIAQSHEPFTLTVESIGSFGSEVQPRIFWIGVKKEDKLFKLQKDVYEVCNRLGIDLDVRKYLPHITMARKYSGEGQYDDGHMRYTFEEKMKNVSWDVTDFVIYETHLEKLPKYEVVATFPLHNPK